MVIAKLITGDKQVKFCMDHKWTYKLCMKLFLYVNDYKHDDYEKLEVISGK
jgi:hypothetical protein